jgi:ADP-heptose:LPS heptosyltransferase
MHILESYALTCGCTIDKPFIYEDSSLVLPSNKYITLHTYDPKGTARLYDHWNKVISEIKNCSSFDYNIIQIGGLLDPKCEGADHSYLGKTTYNSLAYLIKNATLHLGFDSFPVHLASYYNIKIVALYGYYANMSKPYFSDLNKIKIFEPDFSKTKPTFHYNDPYKMIQNINPLDIARSVLSLLEIN